MRAVLASAATGAANAARKAAANIPRPTREDRKSAEKAIGRADVIMFPRLLAAPWVPSAYLTNNTVLRFIVANSVRFCHKPRLHRPADQGLPWQCPCWLSHFGNNPASSTL
jgi:hypothetical protein